MSAALRYRIYRLTEAMKHLFTRREREALPLIKGNMKRALIIKPPGEMFTEAVFVLRDDYFQTAGTDRQELLRQAREAAALYTEERIPQGSARLFPSALASFATGAASAVLALWFAGLL